MLRRGILFALTGGLLLVVTGCVVYSPPVVDAPPATPPAQVEAAPPTPGPAYVWVPGHWAWRGPRRGYHWIPGHWTVPPQPGRVWVPGHWAPGPGGHVWVDGHWRVR